MKLKITYLGFFLLLLSLTIGIGSAQAAEPTAGPGAKPVIKADVKLQVEKVREERKEIRQDRKEDMKDLRASTTMMLNGMRKEGKELREDLRASTTMAKRDIRASTTEMFKKMKDEKKEMMKNMKKDAFEIRKNALVKQLTLTLENLANIRSRVNERITKLESEGKSMTEAKAALAIADDKLAKAKTAVDSLSSLSAPTTANTSAAAAADAEVELTKPRQIGDAAIKAVKEARDALKAVVKIIAPANANVNASTTITNTN